MLIRVEHETRYRFTEPVFLEPHLLRLLPRSDAGQKVESFSLRMEPEPCGRYEIADASGSPALWAWFEGMTTGLVIVAHSVTRTLRSNPFGYLLQPGALSLPPRFSSDEEEALAPFLLQPEDDAATRGLVRSLSREAGQPASFLALLNRWLFRNIEVVPRRESGIQSSEETLRLGSGACRDVAVVFMAACRRAGIPCRYVSGYHPGGAQSGHELHAWAEAYLPGAGWQGYDPTTGLCVADAHVAICCAHRAEMTAPVTGRFRGNAASTLEHRVLAAVIE